MKLHKSLITLSLASFSLIASTLGAQTILNQTWANGSRDTQNLPNAAQWFASNKADQLTVSDGWLLLSSKGGTNYALSYFAPADKPIELAAGQTLQVTFDFSLKTVPATGTPWLRVGIFDSNSGRGRVSADGQGESSDNFKGYRGYLLDEANLRSGYTRIFRRKSSKSSGNLMTSAGKAIYTRIKEASKSKWGGYKEAVRYSGTLQITRNSDNTVTVAASVRDPEGKQLYSIHGTDSGKPLYSKFDTLVFALTKSSRAIALDKVKVDITSAAESK